MQKASKMNFQKVFLVEPSDHRYIVLAAVIDKPLLPFFLMTSAKKKKLLSICKLYCELLEMEKNINEAKVFQALLIPPGRGKLVKERKGEVPKAKFDMIVLIETKSMEKAEEIQQKEVFQQLKQVIKSYSDNTYFINASNIKRIGPVNHKKQGIFLFNYFFADSVEQNISIWEYTAGWFQQETGLDNSTVLLPLKSSNSDYAIINHCRWDNLWDILPSLIFKKSFRSYVLKNFYENNVAAMPILYKLA